jgi:hypothetical protein
MHSIRKSEGAALCERVGRWDGGEQEPGRGIPAEREKESSSSQRQAARDRTLVGRAEGLWGILCWGSCREAEVGGKMRWSVVCWWTSCRLLRSFSFWVPLACALCCNLLTSTLRRRSLHDEAKSVSCVSHFTRSQGRGACPRRAR